MVHALTAVLLALQGVQVDAASREVRVPCKVAPRKLPNLPEIYPIEVIATLPSPRGQKSHETVVVFDVAPSEVHKALESLGLKEGKPARGEGSAQGPPMEILLDLPAFGSRPAGRVRVEHVLAEKRSGLPLPPLLWHFTGSARKDGAYGADVSGTLISLYPVTDEVVLQSALTMKEEGMIKMDTAKGALPPEGTPVTLVLKALASAVVPPAPALAADPDRQVLKLSRTIEQGPLPAPASAPAGPPAPPAPAPADPFQHRREIRLPLPESSKPVESK